MKWLRASLAAVVLACGLSLTMAVQPVAAAAPSLVAPAPVVGAVVGGTAAADAAAVGSGSACVVMTAGACLAAIGLAAAAVGLYATRDSWVPAVKSFLGGGSGAASAPASGGGSVILTQMALEMTGVSGAVLTYRAVYSSGVNANWYYDYGCKTSGGSIIYQVKKFVAWTDQYPPGGGNSKAFSIDCGAGGTPAWFDTYCTGEYNRCPGTLTRWRAADGPTDAAIQYRATAKCVKADGSTQDLVVDYQGQPTGDGAGFLMPSCEAAGLGNHAKSVEIGAKLPGQTDFRKIWDVKPSDNPTYPLCNPGLVTACVLEVWVDGSVCRVGDARCLDWASHAPSRIECHWGSYVVADSKCDMLENAYQPGGSRLTEPEIDGDPATKPTTGTGATGQPSPSTTAPPVPIPTDAPLPTPTAPAPTGPPGPDPAPTATPSPIPDVGDGAGCWPSGSARWNPLEWVLRPVQCAFVWAFVPDEGFDAIAEGVQEEWADSDIGTWIASDAAEPGRQIVDLVSGGGGSCEGPVWTISLGDRPYRFAPLDACSGPMASIAPVVKTFGTVLVAIAGVYLCVNPILQALGIPAINFPGLRRGPKG